MSRERRALETFVFENGSGHDKVIRFRDGRDKIDLSDYAGVTGFGDIQNDISKSWFGTKIDLDDGDSIYLVGISKSQLDADDFIF